MKIYKYTIYEEGKILETVYDDVEKDLFEKKYYRIENGRLLNICPIHKLDTGELGDGEQYNEEVGLIDYFSGFCYSERKSESEIKNILIDYYSDLITNEIKAHENSMKRRYKKMSDVVFCKLVKEA